MNVPEVVAALIRALGGQQRLAEELRVGQNTISRWQSGQHDPGGPRRDRLRQLAARHGLLDEPQEPPRVFHAIPIMGWAGAGGEIDVAFEQAPAEGFEQIDLPPEAWIAASTVADPIGFRVSGGSMEPRYADGDVLIVEREQRYATRSMVGLHAVLRTVEPDGSSRRYVKRIAHGPARGLYNLESIGEDRSPIVGARIAWASPVRVILPDIRLARRPAKSAAG